MTRDLKELIREASELPENDRATLAGAMIESLDQKPTPGDQGRLVTRDRASRA